MLISPSTHKAFVDWVLHGPLILKGLDYNLQYFKVKVAVHAMHVWTFFVLTVIFYRNSFVCRAYSARCVLTSSPEFMQRNPRSTRQAWRARITASNLSLSLYKRRRFFSFTSAILFSLCHILSHGPERSHESHMARRVKSAGKSCWILTFLSFCNKLSN